MGNSPRLWNWSPGAQLEQPLSLHCLLMSLTGPRLPGPDVRMGLLLGKEWDGGGAGRAPSPPLPVPRRSWGSGSLGAPNPSRLRGKLRQGGAEQQPH
jgi:hypothetical protein